MDLTILRISPVNETVVAYTNLPQTLEFSAQNFEGKGIVGTRSRSKQLRLSPISKFRGVEESEA
jgi:hypothetical protein